MAQLSLNHITTVHPILQEKGPLRSLSSEKLELFSPIYTQPPWCAFCSAGLLMGHGGLSRTKALAQKRVEITCSRSQASPSARQQPRSPLFPIQHPLRDLLWLLHIPSYGTGGLSPSHIQGVLLLMMESEAICSALHRQPRSPAASARHTHTPGAEPLPALKVSGLTRLLWLGAP